MRGVGRGMKSRRTVIGTSIALFLAGFIPYASAKDAGPAAMTEARFWSIIAEAVPYAADREKQTAVLRASLEKLTLRELEGYEAIFAQEMRASYSWDLWGAAYIIQGGASDDGFEYFRRWLISQGREAFERAKADPDSLADLPMPDSVEDREFEEIAYLALDVWGEKSGRDPSKMPNPVRLTPGEKPSGLRFSEDPAALKKRYPKLWTRFGTN